MKNGFLNHLVNFLTFYISTILRIFRFALWKSFLNFLRNDAFRPILIFHPTIEGLAEVPYRHTWCSPWHERLSGQSTDVRTVLTRKLPISFQLIILLSDDERVDRHSLLLDSAKSIAAVTTNVRKNRKENITENLKSVILPIITQRVSTGICWTRL